MTIKTLAKRLLKNYRKARKLYNPKLARTHAYFRIKGMMSQTQWRKYNNRHWNKP